MNPINDPRDLLLVARVFERGSLARAALDMGVPASTVSRRVAALEKHVGARLFERTTRSLRPTDIGTQLARLGADIRALSAQAEGLVAEHLGAPRGTLRISVPTAVVDSFLGQVMAEFIRRSPRMRLEVVATDALLDPVGGDFDATIRLSLGKPAAAGSLGIVPLALVQPVLAAARSYLERAPQLLRPADLALHVHIAHSTARKTSLTLVGRSGVPRQVQVLPRIKVDSAPLAVQCAVAGAGIAVLPRSVALRHDLVILQPGGYRPPAVALSILTPSARPKPPKTQAFIALMREFVAAQPALFDVAEPPEGRRRRGAKEGERAQAG